MRKNKIGIYEKALSNKPDLYEIIKIYNKTNFDYLEISIDDSNERLTRLDMSATERKELRLYISKNNVHIHSIVLSANRSYPIGCKSASTRDKGIEIIQKTIELADDLGIPVVQIAGYYTFFSDQRDGNERLRFIESLKHIVPFASWKGIMLGLENMDGEDIISIKDSLEIVNEVNSPWFQLYPDVGNLVANGLDLQKELTDISIRTVSIHLKDTRRNEFRRVPFGKGEVDFKLVSDLLQKQKYSGNFTVEMWNDDKNSLQTLEDSMKYLSTQMNFYF